LQEREEANEQEALDQLLGLELRQQAKRLLLLFREALQPRRYITGYRQPSTLRACGREGVRYACISKSLLSHKALLQGTVLQGSFRYLYRSLLKYQGSFDILTYLSAAGGVSGGRTGMGRRWERELVVGYC